ncbi:MAG: hypothetical protein WAU61_09965 [Smithella sp.]
MAGVFVIHAIMARIIGKEMIYLYCVPFGDTPVFIRFGKADALGLRPRQAVPTMIAI